MEEIHDEARANNWFRPPQITAITIHGIQATMELSHPSQLPNITTQFTASKSLESFHPTFLLVSSAAFSVLAFLRHGDGVLIHSLRYSKGF